MQRMMGLVRRCADDYQMIDEGDKIAVGVSGGKDSLTLLVLLSKLREYYPRKYDLAAMTVDMGMQGMDFSALETLCSRLGVPFHRVETQIAPIIFEHRKEKNPCSMCAKMRRGALSKTLNELGYNKIALGHHYDDAVETFLMNLLYEGRLSCFQPVTHLSRANVTQIRPMLYLTEAMVIKFAQQENLPVVFNPCPVDKHTKRQEIKELIHTLSGTYPDIKNRIFGAMQRQPLAQWGVLPHVRTSKEKLQQYDQSEAGQSEETDDAGAYDGNIDR